MNILLLSVHSIEQRSHFLQKRLHEFVQHYKHNGHQVLLAGIHCNRDYQADKYFIPFPGDHIISQYYQHVAFMTDFVVGKLVDENQHYYQQLEACITFQPDIIQIEQPWLYNFAVKYKKNHNLQCKIILSMHNIEHKNRYNIIHHHLGVEKAQLAQQTLKNIEDTAILNADAIICCDELEKHYVESIAKKHLLVIRNGINDARALVNASQQPLKQHLKNKKYVFYDNVDNKAFIKMMGRHFGCLKPDEFLLMNAKSKNDITKHVDYKNTYSMLKDRAVFVDVKDNDEHNIILQQYAHCLLLTVEKSHRILSKTAEALYYGNYILATEQAMVGFQDFQHLDNVFIANEADEFKRTLRHIMQQPLPKKKREYEHIKKQLTWSFAMSKLPLFINHMALLCE